MVKTRGVLDQHFQNPARTGFTGFFHEIGRDNPVSFCQIIRPEPDFSKPKVFHYSSIHEELQKRKGNKFKGTPSSLVGSCC